MAGLYGKITRTAAAVLYAPDAFTWEVGRTGGHGPLTGWAGTYRTAAKSAEAAIAQSLAADPVFEEGYRDYRTAR